MNDQEASDELPIPFLSLAILSAAEGLWDLLDDIDTLGDACRGDAEAFMKAALVLADKRHRHAKSYDGQNLVWRWEEKPPQPRCKAETVDGAGAVGPDLEGVIAVCRLGLDHNGDHDNGVITWRDDGCICDLEARELSARCPVHGDGT